MILTDYATYLLFQPDSTLSGAQFDYYAEACSNAIEVYLNRNLDLATNIETHWTDDSNTVLLDEYPVNDIYFVSQGFAEYGNISVQGTTKPIQMNYDGVNVNLIYDLGTTKNTFAVSGYNTMTTLCSALEADIESETSGTATVTIDSKYASVSPIYLSNINFTIASNTGIFELYGFDLDNQLSYTLEAHRTLQFNQRLRGGSNAIMVRYNSGYANVASLPYAITDICNRMIRDISTSDDGYVNTQYAREKLGNAEIANWDWNILKEQSVPTNIVMKYSTLLDKYKRFDIAFY